MYRYYFPVKVSLATPEPCWPCCNLIFFSDISSLSCQCESSSLATSSLLNHSNPMVLCFSLKGCSMFYLLHSYAYGKWMGLKANGPPLATFNLIGGDVTHYDVFEFRV